MQYAQHAKTKQESDGLEPGMVMSPIEEQYVLNEYGVLLGTLTVRYAQIFFRGFYRIDFFFFYSSVYLFSCLFFIFLLSSLFLFICTFI